MSFTEQTCMNCALQVPSMVRSGYGFCLAGNGELPSGAWCAQWIDCYTKITIERSDEHVADNN
jgi:hypothetical protein